MAKTKLDAQQAPKRPKAKGAMHDASVAAARARAALKQKAKDKVQSDEDDELEGNEGENSDDSSSSSESQHAAKEDTHERALDKSRTIVKERSTEVSLQSQIDRQKKVNDKKIRSLWIPVAVTKDVVQHPRHNYKFGIISGYFSYTLIISFGFMT
jgi:hypothetical protein